VKIPGELGSRRHINLPGTHVRLPALTEKDRTDCTLGIELGVDIFALSFVREPEDMETLRRFLRKRGSSANVIAKIEDQSGISNLDDILRASDGLMVARGDLGIEIPFESLPTEQRRAVRLCQRLGKPVIIATHMLESMIENPLPTRAEITDIANAVDEQADAIMLSGETTVGKYPVECVETFDKVACAIEKRTGRTINETLILKGHRERLVRSAATLAQDVGCAGIVVFTRSGHLPRVLSALRPGGCPIYAFSENEKVFRLMRLQWGIDPFRMDFHDDPEDTIRHAFTYLTADGKAKSGDALVIITNALTGQQQTIDTIQLRRITDDDQRF
jgi:pyruvate kinase